MTVIDVYLLHAKNCNQHEIPVGVVMQHHKHRRCFSRNCQDSKSSKSDLTMGFCLEESDAFLFLYIFTIALKQTNKKTFENFFGNLICLINI